MKNMITNLSMLQPDGLYAYADYLTWKFTERIELIKGRWLQMAAPSLQHQRISAQLYLQIGNYLQNTACVALYAPADVRLLDRYNTTPEQESYTVVQPDLFVVCDRTKLNQRGCIGAPDFIIEIVSAGNTRHDVRTKFELYAEAGVTEYWIVFPSSKTVNVFDLNDDKNAYVFRETATEEDTVECRAVRGLMIDLTKVFNL